MGMKGHTGHLMGIANGRKMESVKDLPEDYLKCAQSLHPKYIKDPMKAMSKETKIILST
jgi:hypothetical protein